MLTLNWGFPSPSRPPAVAATVLQLPDANAFFSLIEHETLLRRRAGLPLAALELRVEVRASLHPALRAQRLVDLGRWLQSNLRAGDTVAAWPEQQFGVLLPGCPAVHAAGVLHRLLQAQPGRYWPEDWALDLQLLGRVL